MSVATGAEAAVGEISAVMIGIGTSLVLDEFALILHLSDVYWSEQGRVSIEVVSLAVACMGLALVGLQPQPVRRRRRIASDTFTLFGATFGATLHVVLVMICIVKGKYELALLSTFIPFLGRDLRDPHGPARLAVGEALLPRPPHGAGPRQGRAVRRSLGSLPRRIHRLHRRQADRRAGSRRLRSRRPAPADAARR